VESLLGEAEVGSRRTRVTVRKDHNFGSAVGSPSKFYKSFVGRFLWSRCGITTP